MLSRYFKRILLIQNKSSRRELSTVISNTKFKRKLKISPEFLDVRNPGKLCGRRRYSFIHDTHYMGGEDLQSEDNLFQMFKNPETGHVSIGKFLAALNETGLRKSDPRLKEMIDSLKKIQREKNNDGSIFDTQRLDLETFKRIIQPSIGLITRAFKHELIIPEFQEFTDHIEDIYWKCKDNTNGTVASYIPQLKRMSANYWGVSICTCDGQRYSIGDNSIPFTIQSCSKPLTYGLALDLLGDKVVHKYVGQEPSGRNFNELILDYNKKPHNPMINAGAILICALLKTTVNPEMTLAEKFDFTMNYFERLAGREDIGFNNAVFLSEREAADRNYALGFYMREHKCFPENSNFKECMDFYFQCCSLETNCDLVSVIGATLANGGICPLTEEKVLKPESVRDVLSLMHSCGMYDYSGQFAFKVGLPAKSGVSGCLLVVIPNVMGICLWSPPLDALGNSCRGVQFCEELVNRFNFHRFDNLKHASNKSDPRKHRFETAGLRIVDLLFSSASGDLASLRRTPNMLAKIPDGEATNLKKFEKSIDVSNLGRHKLSGMDMTLADYDGRTALHLAAAEGHIKCVEFLLNLCHVPVHVKDRWGRTPLEEALAFGHSTVAQILRDRDANNVNSTSESTN